jgi:hypothetical protein
MEFTINIDPATVFNALTKHRDRFQTAYHAMLTAYQLAAEQYQQQFRAYSKKVADQTLTDDDEKPQVPDEPKDRTALYTTLLNMIQTHYEATPHTHLQFTLLDYQQLIEDQWNWRHQFASELRYWHNYAWSDNFESEDITGFADSSTSTSTSINTIIKDYKATLFASAQDYDITL